MISLVWAKIPVAEDYILKPKQKKQKKGLCKEDEEKFKHYFLYIPRGILLFIQGDGDVAHAGGFCFGQTCQKQETNHHLHFYCCPNMVSRNDVDMGNKHNLIDDRFTYDEDIVSELQNIVLDKS